MKISDFQIFFNWIKKYKAALSKADSSWDKSYCMGLVIVSLDVNIGRLQFIISEDNILCMYSEIFEAIFCCEML